MAAAGTPNKAGVSSGLGLCALGAILWLAVDLSLGSVDLEIVGIILFITGLAAIGLAILPAIMANSAKSPPPRSTGSGQPRSAPQAASAPKKPASRPAPRPDPNRARKF